MPVLTKLFVGNLPETCKRGELLALFEKHGKVVECDIVKNYGFVHFANPEDAKAAVENLNDSMWEGTQLKVELSRSKVRQRPGMGSRGVCYRCGKDGHWSKDCPKGPTRPWRQQDTPGAGPYERNGFRDPYRDPYFEYPPPPPPPPPVSERYRPYPEVYDRRAPPPPPPPPGSGWDPAYYRDRERDARDPYARPPPEYYGRTRSANLPPPPPTRRVLTYNQDRYAANGSSYSVTPAAPATSASVSPRTRGPPVY